MLRSEKSVVGFALGRIAFGLGLIAVPERVASSWLGADAERPAAQVAIRALGARDIALAAGAAIAARRGEPVRPWLIGCAACDLTDLGATLAAGEAIPPRGRWGTVALAGAAAAFGIALAAAADS
jgi:hypothetical protein